nr:hypothetical protein Iba_scaffold2661CG0420 [Ipomoea batatas]
MAIYGRDNFVFLCWSRLFTLSSHPKNAMADEAKSKITVDSAMNNKKDEAEKKLEKPRESIPPPPEKPLPDELKMHLLQAQNITLSYLIAAAPATDLAPNFTKYTKSS